MLSGQEAPAVLARFQVGRGGRYALLLRAAIGPDPERKRQLDVALDGRAPERVGVPSSYNWSTGETHFRAVFLQDLGELAAGAHALRLQLTAGDLKLNELIVTDNPTAFFIDHWQREQK